LITEKVFGVAFGKDEQYQAVMNGSLPTSKTPTGLYYAGADNEKEKTAN
jgi:hypothetical protein